MDALIFDTETTGLIENRTVKLEKQPHVIEFYGELVNLKTGDVKDVFHSLIKPPIALPKNVKGNKGIAEMTGITEDMLKDAPPFKEVAGKIRDLVIKSPACLAHNLTFDIDMVEIEFLRLGEKVVFPKRRICTVEATTYMRGHRLKLEQLYAMLFPGETFVAHRANNDVKALTRIAVKLHEMDVI